ncbi:MAG: hypothetical protein ACKVW3_13115 [Phycisphaerales bacterium]
MRSVRMMIAPVLLACVTAIAQPPQPPSEPNPSTAQGCWETYVKLIANCEAQKYRTKEAVSACMQGANIFLNACLCAAFKIPMQQQLGMPPPDPVDLSRDGRVDVIDAIQAVSTFGNDPGLLMSYIAAWQVRQH